MRAGRPITEKIILLRALGRLQLRGAERGNLRRESTLLDHILIFDRDERLLLRRRQSRSLPRSAVTSFDEQPLGSGNQKWPR